MRRLISGQPPFTMLVANLAGGSNPSRGASGNPVKVRKTFTFQHFPELGGRGPEITPQSLGTPGVGTYLGHVEYTVAPIPVAATGMITVASNAFGGPTTVRIGQYELTTGDDFAVGTTVQATGSATVTVNLSTATITIGGQTLTPAGGPRTSGLNDYDNTLGAPGAIRSNIVSAINDLANGFAAIATASDGPGGLFNLTAVPAGSLGNAVTLTSSDPTITVSDATLTGGLDPDESTALNLSVAIDALPEYSAVAASNVVTVTGLPGVLGNVVLFAATGSSPNNFTFSPEDQRMAGAEPKIGPPLIS